jgi:hypothetical protein
MGEKHSWLDEDGGVAIDDMAKRLESFMEAMADGIVSTDEVAAQETRVADIMRQVEPGLDDTTHGKVTDLLCEMTAFAIMQVLHAMQEARTKTTFKG